METRIWSEAKRRGWNLTEMAKRMGVSLSHLSRVQRGERPIGMCIIQGARKAFPDCDLDYLFPKRRRRTKRIAPQVASA